MAGSDVSINRSVGEDEDARTKTDSIALIDMRPGSARLIFLVGLALALPFWLWAGTTQWFFNDEWDFLAGRNLFSAHDLLRPHNEHWSTVPIIVYRLLFRTFGLRTYLPYQLLVVLLHLTAGFLLWLVMRRTRVAPWVATACGLVFVYLGSGSQDIVWAFQIGFVGSLVCGLGHLLLSDHDGTLDRRDFAGLALGLIGLMSSGIAIPMTVAVGIAVLIRRGWRLAFVHTVPLALAYGAWSVLFARGSTGSYSSSTGDKLSFMRALTVNAAEGFAQSSWAAIAIGTAFALGLYLMTTSRNHRPSRRVNLPLGMTVGAVVFLAATGVTRSGDIQVNGVLLSRYLTHAGRYIHLMSAMLLPALAVALTSIGRRFPVASIVVVAALVGPGLVGNIQEGARLHTTQGISQGDKHAWVVLAYSPVARQVPRAIIARPFESDAVTVGWLIDQVRAGRMPTLKSATPVDQAAAAVTLALRPSKRGGRGSNCLTLNRSIVATFREGDQLRFSGSSLHIRVLDGSGKPTGFPITYLSADGRTIRALAGPISVQLSSGDPAAPNGICYSAP